MEVDDVKMDFCVIFWEESDTRRFSGYLILRHSHIKAEVVLFAIEVILNNATDSGCWFFIILYLYHFIFVVLIEVWIWWFGGVSHQINAPKPAAQCWGCIFSSWLHALHRAQSRSGQVKISGHPSELWMILVWRTCHAQLGMSVSDWRTNAHLFWGGV